MRKNKLKTNPKLDKLLKKAPITRKLLGALSKKFFERL
jgi:hypothetical protein